MNVLQRVGKVQYGALQTPSSVLSNATSARGLVQLAELYSPSRHALSGLRNVIFSDRNAQQDSWSSSSTMSSPSSVHWVTIGVVAPVPVNILRMQFVDSLQLHTR
jgi:hypothetical protein